MLQILKKDNVRGAKLLTRFELEAGDIITTSHKYQVFPAPTYQTIQKDQTQHLLHEELAFLNHSCQPNTVFNPQSLELRAIRRIIAGDELTFFYPSTEWDMASPFTCQCQAENCIGFVAGAYHLSLEILTSYELSPFVSSMLTFDLKHNQSFMLMDN